jgi:UDP-N-acetylglucosamine--N-acetylmuramyl-(pentapeptide) pyrophosphoryl-undecaprenol N-acetylglucosamine transferase
MYQPRVIIAGGGTGGHIFPAVAIGHALKALQPGTELLFVGALGKMEMEKVPQEGFQIVGLDIAGFNRSSLLKNIWLPFKLLKSLWAARRILKEFKPDVVVGVGGYASFPMLRAAQSAGIPTLIQEQNSFAGKSNRVLGKKAKAVCVAYDNMESAFPPAVITKTGNPVRALISQSVARQEEGVKFWNLDSTRKTLLVVGGSLGARSVNEALVPALNQLLDAGLQILWQTGTPFLEEAKAVAKGKEDLVKVVPFIREMDQAYAAADFVVSRAGALAIAELCIVGKPVIFVPYPHAAEDHQTSNAQALVSKGAAWAIPDAQVKAELPTAILKLLGEEATQSKMKAGLAALAIRDADRQIAEKVLTLITSNPAHA